MKFSISLFFITIGLFQSVWAENNFIDQNSILKALAPIEYLPEHGGKQFTIDLDIRFETNSAKLTISAKKQIDELAKALQSKQLRGLKFLIAGHTDVRGNNIYNKKLSLQRAESVRKHLILKYKINSALMQIKGYGESQLKNSIMPTADENRRVEITLLEPHRIINTTQASRIDGIHIESQRTKKITSQKLLNTDKNSFRW